MSIFLSLYPKKFSYSLGGYSHRDRCRAPDRKKSIEEETKVQADDKEPVGGQVVLVKSVAFHRQNKHRLLPSGIIYES
jgi:hypothetical protein